MEMSDAQSCQHPHVENADRVSLNFLVRDSSVVQPAMPGVLR